MKYTIGDVFTPAAIEQLNAFDGNQIEINALKAQLDLIKLKWSDSQSDIQGLFDTQPINMSDNSQMIDGQSLTELGKAIMGNQQGDSNES